MAIKITSNSNEMIKNIYKTTREQSGKLVVLESEKMLIELLEKNIPIKKVFCTQEWYDINKKWANKLSDIVVVCTKNIIEKLSFTKNPPNVLTLLSLNIPSFELELNNRYLILEDIQDPGNLATIIRTAVAFGFNKLFLTSKCASIYNNKVIRSSMNSIFNISINYIEDIKTTLAELESLQYDIFATSLNTNSTSLSNLKITNKSIAIILGNESKGISTIVDKLVKNKIFINIKNVESLNVASAASIVMFKIDELLND